MPNWLPIETAPRDGTEVLLLLPDVPEPCRARYRVVDHVIDGTLMHNEGWSPAGWIMPGVFNGATHWAPVAFQAPDDKAAPRMRGLAERVLRLRPKPPAADPRSHPAMVALQAYRANPTPTNAMAWAKAAQAAFPSDSRWQDAINALTANIPECAALRTIH